MKTENVATQLGTNLELRGVKKSFGGVRALDDVSVVFESGRVTCLVGPNGAGKTTLFNVVTGFLAVDAGEVLLAGRQLGGLAPHEVARLGVGRLFQDVRVFSKMSLLDNVAVAGKHSGGETVLAGILWPLVGGGFERTNLERSKQYLELVGLSDCVEKWAEHLSYGQQKLLAIARLLNSGADCVLLDEPTAGVHPLMVARLTKVIRTLAELGKTVVVIEHNLRWVEEIGEWAHFMVDGRIETSGLPAEVLPRTGM